MEDGLTLFESLLEEKAVAIQLHDRNRMEIGVGTNKDKNTASITQIHCNKAKFSVIAFPPQKASGLVLGIVDFPIGKDLGVYLSLRIFRPVHDLEVVTFQWMTAAFMRINHGFFVSSAILLNWNDQCVGNRSIIFLMSQ